MAQINDLYQSQGYQTSFVSIPPTAFQEGMLKLQAHEGKIGNITVSGNRYYWGWVVKRGIEAKTDEPLNVKALQASVNRSNRFNGFQIKTITLAPNTETGKTDVTLTIADREPWQLSPTVDDQGRPFIGTIREGVELADRSVLGMGDRLTSRYIHAAGTNAAQVAYALPLDARGDEISFFYNYNHIHLDTNRLHQREIEGSSKVFGPTITMPLNKDRTLVADVGFNLRHSPTFVEDTKVAQSSTAFFVNGLTYNKPDNWGRTTLRYQVNVGHTSSNRGNIVWRHEVLFSRAQKLPFNNSLLLRADVVMAPDRLPLSQTLQLGGAYSVRGYTEGLILGDRGYLVNVEHRWPIPFLRAASPWLADRLQGATFFDIGQAWLDHANLHFQPGVSDRVGRTLLMGVGGGLRYRLTQYLTGFLDLGVGLVNRETIELNAQPTVRVHFGVRSDLLSDVLFRKPEKRVKPEAPKTTNHPSALPSTAHAPSLAPSDHS